MFVDEVRTVSESLFDVDIFLYLTFFHTTSIWRVTVVQKQFFSMCGKLNEKYFSSCTIDPRHDHGGSFVITTASTKIST